MLCYCLSANIWWRLFPCDPFPGKTLSQHLSFLSGAKNPSTLDAAALSNPFFLCCVARKFESLCTLGTLGIPRYAQNDNGKGTV